MKNFTDEMVDVYAEKVLVGLTSEEKPMLKLEKSPLNKLTKNFDERCIDALKGARFTTRIKPPNDFFEAYTNPSLCILFFLMCLCIVLVNKIEETVRSD